MNHTFSTTRHRAYTLLEIMIVLAVIAVATFGVLRLFHSDTAKAAVQKEQGNLSSLVRGVQGMYATKSTFAGVSAADIATARIPDVHVDSAGRVLSAFGTAIDIKPATVLSPDDAFQVIYSNMSAKECSALIPAVAGDAYAISIARGDSVVGSSLATLGKITDPATVATECAGPTFVQNAGSVALTYYRTSRSAAVVVPGCAVSCAPQTQTQTVACPPGRTGEINQSRSGTCSAGACPSQVWSAWTTVTSSCAMTPPPPPPPVTPVAPPVSGPACAPATYTRSQACPSGETGVITQSQTVSCPSGILSPWTETSNTCAVVVVSTCQTGSHERSTACPAGEFGQTIERQNLSCDAVGTQIPDGGWYPVSSNCTTTGSCRPSTVSAGQRNVACSPGQFGQIIQDLNKSSVCPSPTSLPIWQPPFVIGSSGLCTACPGPKPEFRSIGCPPGQLGQVNQRRTNSYDCSAAPITLPGITHSAWVTTSSTCLAACVIPADQHRTDNRDLGCTGGWVGQRIFAFDQSRSASCPSPTGSPVWGSWADDPVGQAGTWVSNNCHAGTPPCTPAPAQHQVDNRDLGCTGGWIGQRIFAFTQTRISSCPSPTGSPVWGAWADDPVGQAGTLVSKTCHAPGVCGAAPAVVPGTQACPIGQSGTIVTSQGWNSAAYPTCWTAGMVTQTSNNCVTSPPACVAPGPAVAYTSAPSVVTHPACPSGTTGTITVTQPRRTTTTTTYVCPTPTGAYTSSTASSTDNYGAATTVTACVAAGGVDNWWDYSYGNEGACMGSQGYRQYDFWCRGPPSQCNATSPAVPYGRWGSECGPTPAGYPAGWQDCHVYGASGLMGGPEFWPPAHTWTGDRRSPCTAGVAYQLSSCGQDGEVEDMGGSCD